MEGKKAVRMIAKNKQAYFEYFVIESFEAGIALVGSEVKSLRMGNVNLGDSFCFAQNGEIILKNCHIKSYEKGSYFNVDSRRDRKLLLHKREILRIGQKVKEKGFSLIPLSIYLKGNYVKVELGLCQGKKLHDKRQSIKEKDQKRDLQRQISNY